MPDYYAQTSGWILGDHRTKGEKIEASERAAKFALLNGTLGTEKPPTNAEAKAALDEANGKPANGKSEA